MVEPADFEVIVGDCGTRVWVNAPDGSNVGRFSKRFGLDVHTTVTEQQEGASQCLYCTHEPAGEGEWHVFREKLLVLHGVDLAADLLTF